MKKHWQYFFLAGLVTNYGLSSFAHAADYNLPKRNSYLAADLMAITHIDPAATDSLPYAVPKGTFHIDLTKVPQVSGGPVNIMTLKSTSDDYMWGMSTTGVTYIDKSGDNWKEVARAEIPGIKTFTAEQNRQALGKVFKSVKDIENAVKSVYKVTDGKTLISNGVYSVVDKDNVVYANYGGQTLYAFGLKDPDKPLEGIKILRSFDAGTLSKDPIAGISMTYDGNIIILKHRMMAIVDRNFEKVLDKVSFGQDELVTNSVSVDEKNGIYVASDKIMRKVVWTGNKLSMDEKDGAWSAPYNFGEQPPVVKIGKGTGSTPTLMGFDNDPDKLVVITDGSNQMNLVAFWRDQIPEDFKQLPGAKSRRIAGQIPVTCGFEKLPKFIQSEQSVVVKGYGAFVVNNIGVQGHKDMLVGVMGLGPVFPPPSGAERFEWDPKARQWRSMWSNPHVVSTSMVPVVSLKSNVVLMNGYTKKDGWEVTGLDWDSGKVVHRTIFGQNNYGNGAYALIELLPDNNMVFNSIAGPFRIKYTENAQEN